MEKRRHSRIKTTTFSADIADDRGFFQGSVADISRFGLCLSDLPAKINTKAKMMVVISGADQRFKMMVTPRWSTRDNLQVNLGVQINRPDQDWTTFVMQNERGPGRDMWGAVRR